MLDAVEKIFYQGIPDIQVDNRLQEIVSHAVELLPELWTQAGCYQEAISAYRRALLSHWNLDNDCCARILHEKYRTFMCCRSATNARNMSSAYVAICSPNKRPLTKCVLRENWGAELCRRGRILLPGRLLY